MAIYNLAVYALSRASTNDRVDDIRQSLILILILRGFIQACFESGLCNEVHHYNSLIQCIMAKVTENDLKAYDISQLKTDCNAAAPAA